MGSKSPRPDLDYSQVGGVKVEARNPAMSEITGVALKNSLEAGKGSRRPLAGVDEVLLANGKVVYQCVVPHNGCGETFETVGGARGHLMKHRGRGAAKRYVEETTALKAELAALKRRNAALVAAATRRGRVAAQVPSPNGATPASADPATAEAVAAVEKAMNEAGALIDRGLKMLQAATGAALGMARHSVPDPEIVEKASKYDQLTALLPRQS